MRKNTIIVIISVFILGFVLLSSAVAARTAVIRVKDAVTRNPIVAAQVTVIRGAREEAERNVLFQGPTNSNGEIRIIFSDPENDVGDISFWAEKIGYVTYGRGDNYSPHMLTSATGGVELLLSPIRNIVSLPNYEIISEPSNISAIMVYFKEFESLREYQEAKAAGRLAEARSVSGVNMNLDYISLDDYMLASPRHPDLPPQLGEDPRYFYGLSGNSDARDYTGGLWQWRVAYGFNAYKPGYISALGLIGRQEFYPPHTTVYVPLIKISAKYMQKPFRAPIRTPIFSR